MKTKDELAIERFQKNYSGLCPSRQWAIDTIYDVYKKYENDTNTSILHKIKMGIDRLFLEWLL